jgi:hypothetical protein
MIKRRGVLHLVNILESNLVLTNEYKNIIYSCIFGDEVIDKLLEITDIPKKEDLLVAEMILKEPAQESEHDAFICK